MRYNTGAIPKDPRSTQRKRARKLLFESGRPYACQGIKYDTESDKPYTCNQSPNTLPKNAPQSLELGDLDKDLRHLEANHINKNILDNDLANLEWLCPSCHKLKDMQTEKGVSLKGSDEHGYGIDF